MRAKFLRRLAAAIPLLWLVATVTFVVAHAAPGSFADLVDRPRLSPEVREAVRERFGLDRPLHEQYLSWLGAVARGDLGVSFLYRRPVKTVIREALPATLVLTGTALVLDLVFGVLIAMIAVRRPHGWLDRTTSFLSLGLYGLPSFWLAGLAILVFAELLGWFPPSHTYSVGAASLSGFGQLADRLWHLVLPASCLGLIGAAGTARYLRASLLDIRGSRFILAARARGVPEWRIWWFHALRPALLPVVTLLGLSLPFLVSGSVVIEVIFSWPGMGRVLWTAAWARDIPVILAVTLLGAVFVILGNLIADLLYMLVDPRAREDE